MEELNRDMYVMVTDYVKPNTGKDVSDDLQKLILNNPNRTIFFPDGEYLLSKPICTPANPVNAVSLKLATFAKLKAMDTWTEKEALVRMGAAEPYNSIYIPGSNYYFEGGILDGNGKANGISIDSGRETAIHHVSIKNTEIGIHIKWGANNRSSDADVHSVNIVGNHSKTSIGVLLEGHDNTLTNMRIAGVHVGIQADSGGNIFRNLHPLYIYAGENAEDENFFTSVAFMDRGNDNFYDICYSDQFCTAFSMLSSSRNIYTNSYILWYTTRSGVENAFKAHGSFNSIIRMPHVNFNAETTNALLTVTEKNGSGMIEYPMINHAEYITDQTYLEYLSGNVITPKT